MYSSKIYFGNFEGLRLIIKICPILRYLFISCNNSYTLSIRIVLYILFILVTKHRKVAALSLLFIVNPSELCHCYQYTPLICPFMSTYFKSFSTYEHIIKQQRSFFNQRKNPKWRVYLYFHSSVPPSSRPCGANFPILRVTH